VFLGVGTINAMGFPPVQGLYDPRNEHDACGMGFIAHIKGVKSHAIIGQALEILRNLDHRGAVGADPLLGDGAGLLIQLPDQLFRKWAAGEGKELPQPGDYAVAMCFLPQDEAARTFVIEKFEKFIAKEGQELIGWRDVPTTLDGLGKTVIDRCRSSASASSSAARTVPTRTRSSASCWRSASRRRTRWRPWPKSTACPA
jgi:glutamate synthase (NADPH/NADH) large chain